MNLDEILHNHLNPYFKGGAIERQAKEAMREAVKQALELAAERAETRTNDEITSIIVDKQSILSIIDEIE